MSTLARLTVFYVNLVRSTDETLKGLAYLTESLKHPEYAFSKAADKTNFAMVHGKPVFDLFAQDVRGFLPHNWLAP